MKNLLHSILLLLLTKNDNNKSDAFFINKSTTLRPIPVSIKKANLLQHASLLASPYYITPQKQKQQQNTKLYGKLWDRVEIEEREEIGWYILNCIVSNELALKSQIEIVLQDFPKSEVESISVPISKSLRSHGKRNVVDDIVLYPGYVFVKIQLTCDVYEALQLCPLCRGFMGTTRMKGMYTSLPTIPTMLSPEEVDGFKGLESALEKENETEKSSNELMLKPYQGYEVGQMAKVINGKFKGEEGEIKRLKNLKISVRLFTYGSNYDQWFDPTDIRLLSEVESSRGLSGPDKPIYNKQFQEIVNPDKFKNKERDSARFSRDSSGRNLSSVFGGGERRNRKQDRVYRGDTFYSKEEDKERQERQNWESYKRQNQGEKKREIDDIERALSYEDGKDYNDDWIGSPTRPTSKRSSEGKTAHDFLNDMMESSSSSMPQQEEQQPKKEKTKDDFLNTLLEDFDNSFGDSNSNNNNVEEDDFFATLEQEMLSSSSQYTTNPSSSSSSSPPTNKKNAQKEELYKDDDENFTFQEYETKFLENKKNAELNILEYDGSTQKELTENIFKDDDDLLKDTGADDDFFNSLDLDDLYSPSPSSNDNKEKIDDDSNKLKKNKESATTKKKHSVSSSSISSDYNESKLQKYTVPQLKEELRNKSLKVSGKKAELIHRLMLSS